MNNEIDEDDISIKEDGTSRREYMKLEAKKFPKTTAQLIRHLVKKN